MKRLRVGVIYGGRSSEHEVSLASAAAVFANLSKERFEAVPVRIDRDGRWTIADRPPTAVSAAEVIEHARRAESTRGTRAAREVHLVARPGDETILSVERRPEADDEERASVTALGLDVIFPVLHGPYGEDGTVQGLLELANVPYVGAGVVASAVGMDKAIMKAVFGASGLPIVDHLVVYRHEWASRPADVLRLVVKRLSLPVFVKPANLGSSVGISRVADRQALPDAIDLAASFDRKLLVEAAVPKAREIECAVLGNDQPEASVPGEVVPSREFYDYEAKYVSSDSDLRIPAPLSKAKATDARQMAIAAFKAVDAAGMARVDFLLDDDSGTLYVNEINTIPGFTTISMYAKLWAATGVDYPVLLERLIGLALDRHAEKQLLRTSLP